MQSAQPKNPTNSYAQFFQMKTPKPPTELQKKKTHQIEKARNFGWCRERRVRRREGLGRGGPRKAGEGRRSWGRPGQGGPGKGKSREEGQGRGPQTHGPNWPKGAGFRGLGFRFLGSLVWENHKAEKNASVSHSMRLEKSKVEDKKSSVFGKNDKVGTQRVRLEMKRSGAKEGLKKR